MTEKKKQADQEQSVIALPPLKMILVHAKDERENKKSKAQPVAEQNAEEDEKPQALKRLIKHLEKDE